MNGFFAWNLIGFQYDSSHSFGGIILLFMKYDCVHDRYVCVRSFSRLEACPIGYLVAFSRNEALNQFLLNFLKIDDISFDSQKMKKLPSRSQNVNLLFYSRPSRSVPEIFRLTTNLCKSCNFATNKQRIIKFPHMANLRSCTTLTADLS